MIGCIDGCMVGCADGFMDKGCQERRLKGHTKYFYKNKMNSTEKKRTEIKLEELLKFFSPPKHYSA